MSHIESKQVSIVAPCYNEADNLPQFLAALRVLAEALPQYTFEFIFVDDGSHDGTERLLLEETASDPRIRVVCLARNFGHQRAITAGLDACGGDYVVVMDADLQDPPSAVPEMLRRLEEGYDLVHAVRENRSSDAWLKRFTARWFYAVMRRWALPEMPADAADFKAFNRAVLNVFRLYRERVRFLRGIFATLGFRSAEVRYIRPARCGGQSKYVPKQILRLARDAITSYTVLPLRLSLYLGVFFLALLPCYGVILAGILFGGAGGAEMLLSILIALVWFFSALILTFLGVMGEYLKCILLEVKQRPLYVVRATHNFPGAIVSPGSGTDR